MYDSIFRLISLTATGAAHRYGPPASTHECLGVALEEWQELCDAVRANDLAMIEAECIDLAAVLVRMADACREGGEFSKRSTK